jgi:hypothetical protein
MVVSTIGLVVALLNDGPIDLVWSLLVALPVVVVVMKLLAGRVAPGDG